MNVLFRDIREIMTLEGAVERKARGPLSESHLSLKTKQAMLCSKGQILWVGDLKKFPRRQFKVQKEISLKGQNVFPGFIDAHTHSVFAGDRREEFELRNQGVSYQEIARRGGGILSTVKATRKASLSQLQKLTEERLQEFLNQGVTSVEVKSGYGLNLKEEIKILQSLKKLKSPVRVSATFLGAHALSPEFKDYGSYLEHLQEHLPEIYKKDLARRIDIFAEEGYFSVDQAKVYLRRAREIGFDVSVHAEQLHRTGAARLAIELGARSADHLVRISDNDIKELARSEVTCMLLPASDFYIHIPYPPARKLLDQGARVALSTDFNPGSSPTQNIQFVGLLARLQMRMSLPEVFVALSLSGAHVLGVGDQRGSLTPGKDADFFVTEKDWDQFFYDLSSVPMSSVWIAGKKVV